jgi:hypothetical protein
VKVSYQVKSLLARLKAQEQQIQSDGRADNNFLKPSTSGKTLDDVHSESLPTSVHAQQCQNAPLSSIDANISSLLSQISPSTLQQVVHQSDQHSVKSSSLLIDDAAACEGFYEKDPRAAVFSILNSSPQIVQRLIQVLCCPYAIMHLVLTLTLNSSERNSVHWNSSCGMRG